MPKSQTFDIARIGSWTSGKVSGCAFAQGEAVRGQSVFASKASATRHRVKQFHFRNSTKLPDSTP
ncbi:MAG: hypothetical protein GXP05_00810 [Alphaproteobacteria bacterium]|nr:hypothetical protein [Alphaproteobacteria bacterium]